jgi:threonine dehydrogenase-like Zn-dependent dehydrogenase
VCPRLIRIAQAAGAPMKALTWHGKKDVRIDNVPDPRIEPPGGIVIRVTATAICGSDLHIHDGFVPQMESGDILGHQFMGEVVETGADVTCLRKGDRVVVPFVIACGHCYFCERQLWSCCDTTNPDAPKLVELHGQAGAGLFGYSHLYGGYAGGQAEYVRVPHADHGPIKVNSGLRDEQVLSYRIFSPPDGWQPRTPISSQGTRWRFGVAGLSAK